MAMHETDLQPRLAQINYKRFTKNSPNGCAEISDLFGVLNVISHAFTALTREISCLTREMNLVFPSTHVLFCFLYKLQSFLAIQNIRSP